MSKVGDRHPAQLACVVITVDWANHDVPYVQAFSSYATAQAYAVAEAGRYFVALGIDPADPDLMEGFTASDDTLVDAYNYYVGDDSEIIINRL